MVTNLDQTIAFYADKLGLGFELEFQYEDFYASVIKDGCSIHLKHGMPNIEERQNKRQNNDPDIVFAVDDVNTLYAELLKTSFDIV